jgi:steroid delta-isomerase
MTTAGAVDALVGFYEHLTPESVLRFPEFYAPDAYFKDPFNEVHGLAPIQRIFSHMYGQVAEPRFVVVERVVDAQGAVLVWELHFRLRLWGRGRGAVQVLRGVSHLKFDAAGKVIWHRDYWDTAEELYAKLPVLGCLMRGLKKRLAS